MKNEKAHVSIIIPCFNVKDYVADCLDSLINQSHLPDEIICIDDGSTDDTPFILQEYSSKYKFVKYIQQTRQGVSKARNKGVELATSDYILFVDADDFINTYLVAQFKSSLKNTPNLDLFYFDYCAFKDGEKLTRLNKIVPFDTKSFTSGTNLLTYLLERKNYSGVVWRYFFKRKLLTQKFIEKNHEDHLISLSIISQARNSCYFMNNNAYFHRIRKSSLSNMDIDSNYINTLKKVLNICIQKINTLPLSDTAKRNYILVMNMTYLDTILKSDKLNSKEIHDNLIKELGLLKILIRIYTNNKPNILKNILYALKFAKQHNCSLSTKRALLKCAISKRHPYLDIKNNYEQYSSMNDF